MVSYSNEHLVARRQQMCKMAFIRNTTRLLSDHTSHIQPRHQHLSTSTKDTSSSSNTSMDCCSMENYTGFRIDYDIGDEAHTPSDMIIKSTTQEAMEDADSLQKYNFAFIKRSDGSFTYAILFRRSSDSLTFVMDTNGSTKEVSRKRWSEMVRLVSTKPQRHSHTSDKRRKRHQMPDKSVHYQ